ncbi:unnamed protein product [Caenorhabditis sp. 36 PRJEB53466]|nr:unnamed protein product [Caenorhabditis sp. 36 PRJEB53466]
MPRLLVVLALLLSIAVSTYSAYALEPRVAGSFVDGPASGADGPMSARAQELEFFKRFLPAKERRAPLEGFEDMSGFLRTIDGIQKPRFG